MTSVFSRRAQMLWVSPPVACRWHINPLIDSTQLNELNALCSHIHPHPPTSTGPEPKWNSRLFRRVLESDSPMDEVSGEERLFPNVHRVKGHSQRTKKKVYFHVWVCARCRCDSCSLSGMEKASCQTSDWTHVHTTPISSCWAGLERLWLRLQGSFCR